MSIITQQHGSVFTLAWNRPEKKNALTQAMYRSAAEALAQADTDPSVRVVLLTGTPECFSAGNDIGDFMSQGASEEVLPVVCFLDQLAAMAKPVIAAVNGPAVGVGCTMLLYCDVVVAADSTRFSLPFTQLGVCPEAGASYLLPRMAGHQRASELLLLGEAFDAKMAKECGIVNRVCTADSYLGEAQALAERLSHLPPRTVQTTKALLCRDRDAAKAAFREELEHFKRMLKEPESQEAMHAFLERRKPDFSRF